MQRFLTILLAALCAVGICAAENADAILSRSAKAFEDSRSVTANFTAVTSDGSTAGTIVLSGGKFRLTSPDMTVWYDGHTQWSLSPATEECNITTPTPEELQQVNPLVIVNSFRRNYNARVQASAGNVTTLRLTAKSPKAEIKAVTLEIDVHTGFPRVIVLTDRRGSNSRITVTSIKKGTSLPASTFRFEAREHPGVEVIDLR